MPTDTEMDMSEFMMPTKEKDMSESMMPTDKEIDESGSVLCGRKLPLWLGLLLLLAAGGLLVHLIYFAVRANSKACVDGLQAQKEYQELNHLQRQLNQPQEVLQEKEAEAATCKQTVATLRDSLKKDQARVEELQGLYWPADNTESPRPEFGQSNPPVFFPEQGNRNRNRTRKPGLPLAAQAPFKSLQVTPGLLELLIGRHRYYANQGAVLAHTGSSS
ncbi:hypothetical protein MJT46_006547 [Ovis ammon polii x Ovis aries]|nr:hypothetical protein MJT46_006547 [Ovis ammon polii x Ovis aries]